MFCCCFSKSISLVSRLLAGDPASKQQWLHALSYWCEGGLRLRKIGDNYSAFCAAVQQKNLLPFLREVQIPPHSSADQLGSSQSDSGGGGGVGCGHEHPHRRRQRWWGRRGRNTTLKGQGVVQVADGMAPMKDALAMGDEGSHDPASASPEQAPAGPTGSSPPRLKGVTPSAPGSIKQGSNINVSQTPDIDSIIEMRWMQSRKIAVPPAPPKTKSSKSGTGGTTPRTSAPSSVVSSPTKTQPPRRGAVTTNRGVERHDVVQAPLPPGSPERPLSTQHSRANSLAQAPSVAAETTNGLSEPATSGTVHRVLDAHSTTAPIERLPPEFPPLVSVDHFFNMMATRVCFDLVRNPAFAEHVRARVQRQLSRMHTPEYVQSLEVISVDPGSTAPTVARFAALPTPSHVAWPQMVFDMRYEGKKQTGHLFYFLQEHFL